MVDLSQLEKVVTEEDIQNENLRYEAILYMQSTDWYVIRKMETGEDIPDYVKTKRNECRSLLST